MKTKIMSVMIIALVFGFFFFGSGSSGGFNANFNGYRPTYTFYHAQPLVTFNANSYYNYDGHSSMFNYVPASTSLNYHFGFWAM